MARFYPPGRPGNGIYIGNTGEVIRFHITTGFEGQGGVPTHANLPGGADTTRAPSRFHSIGKTRSWRSDRRPNVDDPDTHPARREKNRAVF